MERRIKAGSEKVAQGDCRASLKHWDAALGDEAFPSLPEFGRAAVYQIAASCTGLIGQEDRAYRYALDGTSQSAGTDALWSTRLTFELAGARAAQGVETVEAMAMRNPDALNATPIRRFLQLERQANSDPALQARLLKVLVAESYQPQDVFGSADIFKRKYAVILADAGDQAAAHELARRIETPTELLKISTDPRLRATLPAAFDGRAETERSLAKARAYADAHPESLAAVVRTAQLQRMLGRPEEALATLQAARPDQPRQVAITDEYVNWWWDGVAKSYQILGRYDDAVKALRTGAATDEYGLLNVS
ncbi:MAG: hypothetical protein C0481_02455 [Phenylobacterium sp.]|uniref:hypothetical protein n=1 Tax=Phenylobacterium sp. TaxID=1871053 RepID=UPI0025EEAB67|nr:hypothetical protein [Phenylobacterium sp.]MBA4010705.1 hypothetical protein [Phenylobacterium sp.]